MIGLAARVTIKNKIKGVKVARSPKKEQRVIIKDHLFTASYKSILRNEAFVKFVIESKSEKQATKSPHQWRKMI